MKILIVSSECAPYQKSGGLGDANADYSIAYKNSFPNDTISVILPLYDIESPLKKLFVSGYELELQCSFSYSYGVNNSEAFIYKTKSPFNNIPVTFVYSEVFSKEKEQYCGNIFKNSVAFSSAILKYIDLKMPENEIPDIIQSTDFPVYVKDYKFKRKSASNIKTVHIIHNAGIDYQGQTDPFFAALCLFDKTIQNQLLKDNDFKKLCRALYKKYNKNLFFRTHTALRFIFENYLEINEDLQNNRIMEILNIAVMQYFDGCIENNGLFNPMIKYLRAVDFWITDSPTYYKEILENEIFSGCLFETLKDTEDKSCAVLAGVDTNRFSPLNTEFIKYNFSTIEERKANKDYLISNFLKEKIENKVYDKNLFLKKINQVRGGFKIVENPILIFMACRCDINQKGIDIAFYSMKEVLKQENILFIFSAPESSRCKFIQDYLCMLESEEEYKGKYVFIDSYIPIEQYCAGSDLFLMPSRFEPCGFSQLIAMRFGCIPVICSTGGLNDTVTDFSEDNNGTGFKTPNSFYVSKSPEEYRITLIKALKYIRDEEIKNKIINNAMNYDCSWNKEKVTLYNKVYLSTLRHVTK